MADLQSTEVNPESIAHPVVNSDAGTALAHTLARKSRTDPDLARSGESATCVARARKPQDDPDLARLIAAWPTLPGPIRAAVLALMEASARASGDRR